MTKPFVARRAALIGAGRLGTALGIALTRASGIAPEIVVARRLSHARRAARLIGAANPPATGQGGAVSPPRALSAQQLADLPPDINLCLIATPDDVIEKVAAELADHLGNDKISSVNRSQNKSVARQTSMPHVALHTSGALSSAALAPLRAVGWHTGSLHPLLSVSDAASGAESLQTAFFCVEGDRAAIAAARALVKSLGARSFTIKSVDKALYHAAAVMTSGHTVALFATALDMLGACGIDAAQGRELLLPLLASTLANLQTRSPADALTGSFARADVATIKNHLAALAAENLRDAETIYRLLGLRSVALVTPRAENAKLEALAEIERLLNE